MMNAPPAATTRITSPHELDLFARGQALYAVVDPTGLPDVSARLNRLPSDQAYSLYSQTPFADYTTVSPYLVQLNADLLRWLTADLQSIPWGILIFSRLPFAGLFQHLRRFLSITLPDGQVNFFRFYDARVLKTFLSTDPAISLGFWNGVAGYGWSEEGSIVSAVRPSGLQDLPIYGHTGPILTPELQQAFSQVQVQDFIHRCSAYLTQVGRTLPPQPGTFFNTLFNYASSVGITAEIDLVRFASFVLAWPEMRTIAPVRELLTYPGLTGSDKVDLMCEAAAFGSTDVYGAAGNGLDPEAKTAATLSFLAVHETDRQFQQAHPPGVPLTLQPQDAPWRKEWLNLYKAEIADRAKATSTTLGSVQV